MRPRLLSGGLGFVPGNGKPPKTGGRKVTGLKARLENPMEFHRGAWSRGYRKEEVMLRFTSQDPDFAPGTSWEGNGQDSRPESAPSASMQVIVFSSQKGGSGKTTLCGQLAVQAQIIGAGPVAMVDTDPQGSLSQWWNARQSETPQFVRTQVEHLRNDLDELRWQGIKLVFVDTPPAVTDVIHRIVGHADLVVIPTRPSPHDLRAVGATLDIVEDQGKPLIFAVNGATPRAQITSDAAVALSQHGTVAPVTIHHRTDFATSMVEGSTVMEDKPGSRSATEIAELWQYIAGRLGKTERRTQQLPFHGPDRRYPNQGRADQGQPSGEAGQPTTFGRRTASSRPVVEAV